MFQYLSQQKQQKQERYYSSVSLESIRLYTKSEHDFTDNEFEQFVLWAFGPYWDRLKDDEFRNYWNVLHHECFLVESSDRVGESIERMVNWFESNIQVDGYEVVKSKHLGYGSKTADISDKIIEIEEGDNNLSVLYVYDREYIIYQTKEKCDCKKITWN